MHVLGNNQINLCNKMVGTTMSLKWFNMICSSYNIKVLYYINVLMFLIY